jgi:hypothetical protein
MAGAVFVAASHSGGSGHRGRLAKACAELAVARSRISTRPGIQTEAAMKIDQDYLKKLLEICRLLLLRFSILRSLRRLAWILTPINLSST